MKITVDNIPYDVPDDATTEEIDQLTKPETLPQDLVSRLGPTPTGLKEEAMSKAETSSFRKVAGLIEEEAKSKVAEMSTPRKVGLGLVSGATLAIPEKIYRDFLAEDPDKAQMYLDELHKTGAFKSGDIASWMLPVASELKLGATGVKGGLKLAAKLASKGTGPLIKATTETIPKLVTEAIPGLAKKPGLKKAAELAATGLGIAGTEDVKRINRDQELMTPLETAATVAAPTILKVAAKGAKVIARGVIGAVSSIPKKLAAKGLTIDDLIEIPGLTAEQKLASVQKTLSENRAEVIRNLAGSPTITIDPKTLISDMNTELAEGAIQRLTKGETATTEPGIKKLLKDFSPDDIQTALAEVEKRLPSGPASLLALDSYRQTLASMAKFPVAAQKETAVNAVADELYSRLSNKITSTIDQLPTLATDQRALLTKLNDQSSKYIKAQDVLEAATKNPHLASVIKADITKPALAIASVAPYPAATILSKIGDFFTELNPAARVKAATSLKNQTSDLIAPFLESAKAKGMQNLTMREEAALRIEQETPIAEDFKEFGMTALKDAAENAAVKQNIPGFGGEYPLRETPPIKPKGPEEGPTLPEGGTPVPKSPVPKGPMSTPERRNLEETLKELEKTNDGSFDDLIKEIKRELNIDTPKDLGTKAIEESIVPTIEVPNYRVKDIQNTVSELGPRFDNEGVLYQGLPTDPRDPLYSVFKAKSLTDQALFKVMAKQLNKGRDLAKFSDTELSDLLGGVRSAVQKEVDDITPAGKMFTSKKKVELPSSLTEPVDIPPPKLPVPKPKYPTDEQGNTILGPVKKDLIDESSALNTPIDTPVNPSPSIDKVSPELQSLMDKAVEMDKAAQMIQNKIDLTPPGQQDPEAIKHLEMIEGLKQKYLKMIEDLKKPPKDLGSQALEE